MELRLIFFFLTQPDFNHFAFIMVPVSVPQYTYDGSGIL